MKYYIINILGCVAYGTENWVGGEFFFLEKNLFIYAHGTQGKKFLLKLRSS